MSSNYGNVLAGSDDDLTSDLFRAAILYYMNRQGSGSGSTPNFYNIPLTPEQKRVEDEKWNVYKAGGSDAQKTVAGLGKQFLSQLPSGPSGFQFMSPELKNQPFAGGIKLPTFDFSKLPTTTGTPTPPALGPGTSLLRANTGDPRLAQDHKIPTDGESLYGDLGRTHFGDTMSEPGTRPGMDSLERGSDDPLLQPGGGGLPLGMQYADGTEQWAAVKSWWGNFQKEHPNWAKYGPQAITAALSVQFGVAGAFAGRLLQRLLLPGPTAAQPPAQGGNVGRTGGATGGDIP